ncbi:unnamed protein product [Rotaria socialis]|uniref:Uncharacterized protein n=1 Tax=Rotaria socialis TaxID=392032 RepID=A0A818PG63_9BILA|nr:unnamed protein product [Rotaria socialis]CAF3620792.1 unnamed protein product [Rotaria socialis]CAF4221214.1 unnamed protein product [Rotaria socialis]CAF4241305.1 unnamed protein product [Rotaria socialis]
MVSLEKSLLKSDWLFVLFFALLTGGCACLSLLWIINAIWFYKQAFKVEPYPQQAEIRKYVIRSAIGAFN